MLNKFKIEVIHEFILKYDLLILFFSPLSAKITQKDSVFLYFVHLLCKTGNVYVCFHACSFVGLGLFYRP